MVKVMVTISAFLISFLTVAQVSENRNVADFSSLKASTGIEVLYTVSNIKSVKVETDNINKMSFIKTEVENGTLQLFVDTNSSENSTKKAKKNKRRSINGVSFDVLKITVSGPSLKEIKASSSASIQITNTNTHDELQVKVSSSGSVTGIFEAKRAWIEASSSGDFSGSINATELDINASSSADVTLSGKTNLLNAKASSSANCMLKNVISEEAIVKASSSADVEVHASQSIIAKASSSGDVRVYGNPTKFSKEESSSGLVSKK